MVLNDFLDLKTGLVSTNSTYSRLSVATECVAVHDVYTRLLETNADCSLFPAGGMQRHQAIQAAGKQRGYQFQKQMSPGSSTSSVQLISFGVSRSV